jgi:hypothetical protein
MTAAANVSLFGRVCPVPLVRTHTECSYVVKVIIVAIAISIAFVLPSGTSSIKMRESCNTATILAEGIPAVISHSNSQYLMDKQTEIVASHHQRYGRDS